MWVKYLPSQITAEQRSFFNKNNNNKKRTLYSWTLYIIHLIFVTQTNRNMYLLGFYHFKVRIMMFNATFSNISVIKHVLLEGWIQQHLLSKTNIVLMLCRCTSICWWWFTLKSYNFRIKSEMCKTFIVLRSTCGWRLAPSLDIIQFLMSTSLLKDVVGDQLLTNIFLR